MAEDMKAGSYSNTYRLEAIEIPTSVQQRVIRVAKDNHCGQLILQLRGSITINDGIAIQGPALLWYPDAASNIVKISAGSESYLLNIPKEVLLRVSQSDIDSAGRRLIPNHILELALNHHTELQATVQQSLLNVMQEVNRHKGISLTLVVAHLSIIWVSLWREVGAEDMLRTAEKDIQSVLQRFRELIEAHYRDRWGVKEYSNALQISHDRLYTSCKRELGLTPIQLIHERLLEESKLALERSALNIEQIATTLGFRDSTHFSHFFKRMTDYSPRRYRTIHRQSVDGSNLGQGQNFAHWP